MKIRSTLGTVSTLLMLVGSVQTTVSAQSVNAHLNRIVGLWDVQTTIRNCDTGAPLVTGWALHKFELGGTAHIVPASNLVAAAERVGIWRHVQHNDYRLDFKEFRFDAAGNNIGWVIVKINISINDDGTKYEGSGESELFDSNGNRVAKSGCPAITGTRFVPLE